MRHHQWPSQDEMCALGWIASLEEAVKPNSICSSGNLINYSLTMHASVARGYIFFAYSAKEGRKWITKQVALNKSIPYKRHNDIPPKWNII